MFCHVFVTQFSRAEFQLDTVKTCQSLHSLHLRAVESPEVTTCIPNYFLFAWLVALESFFSTTFFFYPLPPPHTNFELIVIQQKEQSEACGTCSLLYTLRKGYHDWLVVFCTCSILLCILCPSCCSIYITSETPNSGSSEVVATKKVSPRKCSPRLGVVGSEDEDDSSDIDENTMPEVFPSSPISLLPKGTMQRTYASVAINKNLWRCFSFSW